jgi:outer membrane protein
MTRRVLLLLAGLPSLAAAQPPNSPVLSFEEALKRALDKNLAVSRSREDVAAAEGQRRAMFSLILPKLAANGSFTRNSDEVSFGSGEDARTILPRNDWNLRLTVNQPIFAGLREKKAYDQAKVGLAGARDAVSATEDAALLQVAGDYLAAVYGNVLIEVERANLALAEQRRQHARNLVEAGEATRVELLRAETAIKAAERRVVAARQLREAALGRLRVALVLEGDLAVKEPESVAATAPDEAMLQERAAQLRPEIRQAQHALRVAELEIGKQWGAYLPVVAAEAGYVRQRTTFPKNEFSYAKVQVSVPLFQGSDVSGRVAMARARKRQAEMALDEARRTVREDVHTTVLDLEAARTNATLAREQLATAEEEYQQTFERYREQEATALDVEAAESSLSEARRAVVGGRVELRLAELAAWAAGGSLKSALLQEAR